MTKRPIMIFHDPNLNSKNNQVTFISAQTTEKAIEKAIGYRNFSWSDPISSFMVTAFNSKTIKKLNNLYEEKTETYKEGQRFIIQKNDYKKELYSNELGFLIEEDGQKYIQTDHGLHELDDNFKPAFSISPYHFPPEGFKNLVIIFEENEMTETNYNILQKIVSKTEKQVVIIANEYAIAELRVVLNIY